MGNDFDIVQFLKKATEMNASDIHIRIDTPPALRINGVITKLDMPPITEQELGHILDILLPKVIKSRAQSAFDLDFSFEIKDVSRFRVNLSRQLGRTALVIRTIPHFIQGIDQLNLPKNINQFTKLNNGIVLITGPTGSGKSTTIASMIESINASQAKHIITIEDPIEFIYTNKKSIITQRQVGIDTSSFPDGVKFALRQDPDVIVIGEIRDKETVSSALKASETGHLVFATLHTNDSIQTINRIINLFEPKDREYVRHQLAETLRGTISQKLIPRVDKKGRIPACEILVATPTVKDLIIKDELEQIYDLVKKGSFNEMLTLNMSLHALVKNDIITQEQALEMSDKKGEIQQMFRGAYHGTMMGKI